MLELLSSPFEPAFQDFVSSLKTSCLICSPYITADQIKALVSSVQTKGIDKLLSVEILTDLSTSNLVQGATDGDALLHLTNNLPHVTVTYLPRVHAKVFVADDSLAIIGSANFTGGGSRYNFEYGVRVRQPEMVCQVREDMGNYIKLGAEVPVFRLAQLSENARLLREAFREEQKAMRREMRALSTELERKNQDDLIRIRVQARSVNAIFSETILYLLVRGEMNTKEMNEAISHIHPDLCDAALDRIIDGKHYGKLWKHQVRGAQVTLNRRGRIDYDATRRVWHLKRE